MVFAGLRIGLYGPIRNMYQEYFKEEGLPSLRTKIITGITTGAIGISFANPADMVKVRLQAQRSGGEKKYSGVFDVYRKVWAAEGIPGLWTGLVPNLFRNSIINAAELASYDQYKEICVHTFRMKEGYFLHFICAFAAGFTACIFGSPFDVMKTRMMNSPDKYPNIVRCFSRTLGEEGPMAFYKGFTANFTRLGSWNVVMFMTLEQVKSKVMWPKQE